MMRSRLLALACSMLAGCNLTGKVVPPDAPLEVKVERVSEELHAPTAPESVLVHYRLPEDFASPHEAQYGRLTGDPASPAPRGAQPIGELELIGPARRDPAAAIDELRRTAASLGAHAIVDVHCEPRTTPFDGLEGGGRRILGWTYRARAVRVPGLAGGEGR